MVDFLLGMDEQILFLFNGYHTAFLDTVFMWVTQKYSWVPFYVVLVGVLFHKCGWRATLCLLVGIALAITLSDQMCAHVIRPLVYRLRPSNPLNPISEFINIVNGYRSGMYGFPSCHAANTIALATFISLVMAKRGWTIFMIVWAMLVSASRMYLGVHYPSDILVGAMIGCAMGWLSYLLIVKIMTYKRFGHAFTYNY